MCAAQPNLADLESSLRHWYWPPYLFTKVVVAFAVVAVFMANFPAIEVPHAGMQNGKYGPHFECVTDYEHGWPLRYIERDRFLPVKAPTPRGPYWKEASAWTPWGGIRSFYALALVADIFLALVGVIAIGTLAQYWRLRRNAVWQVSVKDLLMFLALVGIACAWIYHARIENQREETLLKINFAREGRSFIPSGYVERDCAAPAYLPKAAREYYHWLFDRAVRFDAFGSADLAPNFRHALVLSYPRPDATLGGCLRQMPQLEAIDFMDALHGTDYDPQLVGLGRLPPMPNLRGVNLYETDANDSDLEWLGKCPRLERICLFDTDVTDVGMWRLADLNRLRILEVKSEQLTDGACKASAEITSLEELYLDSDQITDSGVQHLRPLRRLKSLEVFSDLLTNESCNTIAEWSNLDIVILESTEISDAGALAFAQSANLKRLQIRAPVSDAAAAKLKTLLPKCEVLIWH